MNIFLKIISVFVILVGIGMVWGAHYINTQVAQGKIQISDGQAKLDASEIENYIPVPGVSKMFGSIGNKQREAGRQKIAAGNQEIAYYTNMAQNLQIGGYVLIVLGIAFFCFTFRRKS